MYVWYKYVHKITCSGFVLANIKLKKKQNVCFSLYKSKAEEKPKNYYFSNVQIINTLAYFREEQNIKQI